MEAVVLGLSGHQSAGGHRFCITCVFFFIFLFVCCFFFPIKLSLSQPTNFLPLALLILCPILLGERGAVCVCERLQGVLCCHPG